VLGGRRATKAEENDNSFTVEISGDHEINIPLSLRIHPFIFLAVRGVPTVLELMPSVLVGRATGRGRHAHTVTSRDWLSLIDMVFFAHERLRKSKMTMNNLHMQLEY
jgi:hypothetical protein